MPNPHIEKDLRLWTKEELQETFSSKRSGRIVLSKLIKAIILQINHFIKEEKEPPLIGNIRTFWYRYVKVVLSRIEDDDHAKLDPYDNMLRCFSSLVEEGTISYKDFDFTDENWENRRVGREKGSTLIFTEKRGWIRLLLQWHEKWDTSVIALGGFPSLLTSEYTASSILKTFPNQDVKLIGIVDYDPSGFHIAKSFQEQLEKFGVTVSKTTLLIDPKYYTEREIQMYGYQLKTKHKTRLKNWMDLTNGVDGKYIGLESESMELEKIESLLKNAIG